MLERIGVIGDVHGADRHLAAALEWLNAANLDAILCVGDVADGPGNLNRCIELLRDNSVFTVRGNHDDWLLDNIARDLDNAHTLGEMQAQNRQWLDELPLTRQWETPFGALLLCHGVGGNFMRDLRPDDDELALHQNRELQQLQRNGEFSFMINGHTHQRMLGRFGNLVNLNAGKLATKHSGVNGGAWQVDFAKRQAQLRLFDRMVLGDEIQTLPFP